MEYLSIGSERGLFLKRDVLPRKETCIKTFVEDGELLIGKIVFLAFCWNLKKKNTFSPAFYNENKKKFNFICGVLKTSAFLPFF